MARRTPPLPPPPTVADTPQALIDQEIARRKQAGLATPALAAASTRGMTFKEFVPGAWRVLEGPQRPFLPNWHVDAVADHLNAVLDSQHSGVVHDKPCGGGRCQLWLYFSNTRSESSAVHHGDSSVSRGLEEFVE